MRRVILSLAVTTLVAAALPAGAASEPASAPAPAGDAPVAAPPPAPKPKPKPAKDDPNRIVCVRQHVVGSNRPQKVCTTIAERDRLRDATARVLSDQRGASAPPAGPGVP